LALVLPLLPLLILAVAVAMAMAMQRDDEAVKLVELAKQNTVKRNLQLNLAIAFLALLPPIQLDSICVPATVSSPPVYM